MQAELLSVYDRPGAMAAIAKRMGRAYARRKLVLDLQGLAGLIEGTIGLEVVPDHQILEGVPQHLEDPPGSLETYSMVAVLDP